MQDETREALTNLFDYARVSYDDEEAADRHVQFLLDWVEGFIDDDNEEFIVELADTMFILGKESVS